jgi:hypothetical protein
MSTLRVYCGWFDDFYNNVTPLGLDNRFADFDSALAL